MHPILLLLSLCLQSAGWPMVVTDQAQHRIVLVLAPSGEVIREWRGADIPEAHRKWFRNPSEAKMSRNGKFILMCASGGGAAIIRTADAKTLWYDSVGGNPHSLDIAPHNTVVVASSTGNRYTVFRYDTTVAYAPNRPRQSFFVSDAHAVNFYDDRYYIAGRSQVWIYTLRQGNPGGLPGLVPDTVVNIPGRGAHDMIYGSRYGVFYLTTVDTLLEFHTQTNTFHPVASKISRNIKSFSEGNDDFPTTVTVPKEEWWTDEVTDLQGKTVLKLPGARIYKARWMRGFINTYTEKNAKGDTTLFKSW